MKTGITVLLVVLLGAFAFLVLPAYSLGSFGYLPNVFGYLWQTLSALGSTSEPGITTRYIEVYALTLSVSFLGIYSLVGRRRNIPLLITGYWIFTLLGFPIALQSAIANAPSNGNNPESIATLVLPLTTIAMAVTAFVIRFAIVENWSLGTKEIKVGETLLLVVFGEILLDGILGKTNLFFFITDVPQVDITNVVWQIVGTFLVSLPFALADYFLLSRESRP